MPSDHEPAGAERPLWDAHSLTGVHGRGDKAQRVRRMFDAIAPTYERVNRWASAGQDASWRREMVRLAAVRPTDVLLDVACGTGDVMRAFAGGSSVPRRIIGVDFSWGMLSGAAGRVSPDHQLLQADGMHLPLRAGSVTIVTCAFGIRNFQDLGCGLAEMSRVLQPGGRAVLLEFSLPRRAWLRRGYLVYFRQVLPRLAGLLSGDRSGAYRYLPESVVSFLGEEAIRSTLRSAGFIEVTVHPRTWGIVSIFVARKPGG